MRTRYLAPTSQRPILRLSMIYSRASLRLALRRLGMCIFESCTNDQNIEYGSILCCSTHDHPGPD
jgi:hypothetical protein